MEVNEVYSWSLSGANNKEKLMLDLAIKGSNLNGI